MAEQDAVVLKDRSGWLTFFGVIKLIFGVLSALYIPLMFFSIQASSHRGGSAETPSIPLQTMVPALFLFGFLAVFWFVMGIGSLKAARWARALTLIAAWLWLIAGGAGFLVFLSNIPTMARMMKEAGEKMPPGFIQGFIIFQTVFMFIIFILLPVIFILFYGSAGVKATMERRDPKVRWTDRVPLPVLALCLLLIVGVTQMVSLIFIGIGIPFFGKFIEGLPMVVITLGICLILLYLAWNVYHVNRIGWFGTAALVILGIISSLITFRNMGMMELYSRMGYQGKQLEMMQKMQSGDRMEWMTVITAAIWLGFLWYLWRYFKPNQFEEEKSS